MLRSVKPVLLLVFAAVLFPPAAQTATLVVDYDDGPYFTIGAAVTAAGPTDTVSIEDNSPATYDEMISVAKNITIVDNAVADVVLTKTVGGATQAFFMVSGAASVTLQNLTFNDTDGMAIKADGATVTVEDCFFSGCDGDEEALGGTNGATIDLVNGGVVNLDGCTFDNTLADLSRNGSIIAGNGSGVEVNATNCTFKNHRNPAGNGALGEKSAAVSLVFAATGTFTRCQWACDGDACVLVALDAGATIDRCLLEPLVESATDTCDALLHEGWGTSYFSVINSIIDAHDTQPSSGDPAGIWIDGESYVNVNNCTIIRCYHGIFGIGDPYDLKVTNSLIGRNDGWGIRWVQQLTYTWDLWLEYNHFWANPSGHRPFPGSGITYHSNVGNTDGDDNPGLAAIPWPGIDPAFVNYEIQNTAEMADLALSTLLGPPLSDDYDEVGVRPRASDNDKGAQEGQAPRTSVEEWEALYR